MIGETLGKYTVERELGSGGMGAVYLATHAAIGKRVAIKVLHPEKASESLSRRFFNEARAAARVEHPGMVEVIDYATGDGGRAYLVMEYLEGESLAARLKRGPLDQSVAIELIRQAVSAIAAAHAAGIIHRDLKPQNLFLVADDAARGGTRLKVLDFGIAKLREPGTGEIATDATAATRTGEVFGTPLYMSPEQCRGAGEVTAASDIYSLGAVLYDMVSSGPPFVHEGMGEVISDHLRTPPTPPRQRGARISPSLETLILGMLAKRPDRRPTASEVIEALDRAAGHEPAPPGRDGAEIGPTLPSKEMPVAAVTATAMPAESDVDIDRAGPAETVTSKSRTRVAVFGAAVAAVVVGGAILAITRPWSTSETPPLDHATASDAELDAACGNKDGDACFELGNRVLRSERGAEGGPLRFDLAFPRYLAACDVDHARGCTATAELYEAGNGVRAAPTRAVRLFDKGCRLGDHEGCAQLGLVQLIGAGVEPDAAAAQASFERACELGSPIGCREAGRGLSVGLGAEPDEARAAELWQRALTLGTEQCESGDTRACTSLGVQWYKGDGVEKDEARSFALLQRACEMGEADGCANVSQSYIMGIGVEANPKLGLELAERGCRDGSRSACEVVGLVVGNGYAGDQDRDRARRLFEDECAKGDRFCSMLVNELVIGNIMPRDRPRAIELGTRACEAGRPMACEVAANQIRIVHKGALTDAHRAEIQRLLDRACSAGESFGCRRLGLDHRAANRHEDAVASFDRACRLSAEGIGCAELGEQFLLGQGTERQVEHGLSLVRDACERETIGACRVLGDVYRHGRGTEVNGPRALEAYRRGCDRLDDKACTLAAAMLDAGEGVAVDKKRAAELRKRACSRSPSLCRPTKKPPKPKKP